MPLSCHQCRAELPDDAGLDEGAVFCPMCGGRFRPPVPNPAAQEKRTLQLSAAASADLAADLAALQSSAGPARAPGAPRPPVEHVGVHRIPGTPARIPISPRPGRIVLGVLLLGFGLWAAALYLPGRDLAHELHVAGTVAGLALIGFGLFIAVAGAVYRGQIETICRRCHRQVIGWKRPFGLQCPLDRHYARVDWFMLIVAGLFWVAVLAAGAGVAYLALL